jgi:hypothetical protein
MRAWWVALVALGVVVSSPGPAGAQTPDGQTPAEEEACTKYEGEGARHGLCIAYCEAQDCEKVGGDQSCMSIQERFIEYSVKKGYAKGPKDKPAISCSVTACTADDASFCGGQERDCQVDGACVEVCTATFAGLDSTGQPLCRKVACAKCVAAEPK